MLRTVAAGPATPAVWFDLQDPSEAERATVERATGIVVPARSALSEIENSSRLVVSGTVLRLSMPVVARAGAEETTASPLGFVLTPDHLLTVRFTDLPSIETVFAGIEAWPAPRRSSAGIFLALFDAIVDRLADVLEAIGAETDALSKGIFQAGAGRDAGAADAALRGTLGTIGRTVDRLSKIRDSLLGAGRILGFVEENAASWIDPATHTHFRTLKQDIVSLQDYDSQLTGKVQFLLDATLGFINIEQNNIFKILTVVSVVGIPPTLVAGIYGMNFKGMPEYEWTYGYEYGWALMIVTALVPLIWFRRRRWI